MQEVRVGWPAARCPSYMKLSKLSEKTGYGEFEIRKSNGPLVSCTSASHWLSVCRAVPVRMRRETHFRDDGSREKLRSDLQPSCLRTLPVQPRQTPPQCRAGSSEMLALTSGVC